MTSKTQSKPSSEQLLTLSPQLQHRGKLRYTQEDLRQGALSLLLLCSRLQSSLPSGSFKPILTSFQDSLLLHSKQLDALLMSLEETDLSSPEDPSRTPQT